MRKIKSSFIFLFLFVCILFTCISCKGINRGEGYVFLWSENDNYAKIMISDTEYIHFNKSNGIGEWVVGGSSSPITIRSVYCPTQNADAYRLIRYNTVSDVEFAKIYLGFGVSENITSDSFYLHNPDREEGTIHIMNELTEVVIYASQVETSYQENVGFSITSHQWKEFLNYDDSTLYQSLEHLFWYSPSSNVGEWTVNGEIIPIEIELLPHGPGIKIYDVSTEDKQLILYSSATLSDNDDLILDGIEGDMFYNNSVETITLAKTIK